jgi:hypothetical protein
MLRGNAAIHVQPTSPPSSSLSNHLPCVGALPLVSLESVEVTSFSGQNITNYRGGNLLVKDCSIQDCAATGFVDCSTSAAVGHYCQWTRRIAPRVWNRGYGCGIVGNSSIGVSVYNTVPYREFSDMVANRYQLETEPTPMRLRMDSINAKRGNRSRVHMVC